MIVAMDGPAGCGKSTIAKLLSERQGFVYINSGNFYRTVAFSAIERHLDVNDRNSLIDCATSLEPAYQADGSIVSGGRTLSKELRTAEVDAIVAQVSAVPEIRHIVNAWVRSAANGKDVVVEGRDMTTVVFPDAELKFYLDASVRVRAGRRFDQGSSSLDLAGIEKNIEMRDRIDREKEFGALKVSPDARYLDTSGLTIEDVYSTVYDEILHIREAHGE
jgi:cytidylate kinase